MSVHRMIPPGGRVVAAVSGGSDSVALVLVLRELERVIGCEVAGIAHLNHGLRDAAVDDERFCGALAAQLGVPFFLERVRVAALAREQRRSIEDAARVARYAFFERVRIAASADAVATGHTRDDQAETFLLRLLRGAGTRGLAGILPVSGCVVRPLIDVRRDELRQYLADRGQPYRDDETNRDVRIPRNRIRHELIPSLERDFSNGITEILAREAELARLDNDRLQNEAIDSAGLIVLTTTSGETVPLSRTLLEDAERGWGPAVMSACGPSEALEGSGRRPPPSENERGWGPARIKKVQIDAAGLAALHPALASRLARIALSILAPDRFVGFDHVEALLALAAASSGSVSLPGQQAIRRASRVELVRGPVRPFSNSFSVPLSIPGEVTLGAQGWVVSAEMADPVGPGHPERMLNGGLSTVIQASQVVPPLVVRSRRAGDRVKPRGLGGRSKKLQDFLVDRKIAREQRDLLPLVVDGDDRIVWVVGHPAAEDFRVTEPSQGVIFLKARRLGGQG
jgi:tRNA(Ile)-lysidine synthase